MPQELQVAAEVAISYRCLKIIQELNSNKVNLDNLDSYLIELEAIATEADHLRCKLEIPQGKESLEKLILHTVKQILFERKPENIEADSLLVNRMIKVGEKLHLKLWLDQAKETYYYYLHEQILPNLFVQTG